MTRAWDLTSSPFFSVIGTNHTPSSEELDQLKELLAGPLDERSRLRLEIARLVSEEKKIEEYIEAHQALMSPIRRIPQELLTEIFVRCLPDSSPYGLRSLKYAPLLLLGVCKHWTHTARVSPLLWSSLHIHFPAHLSEENASKRIAGVALWLKRSAALPISLSIHGATSYLMAQDPYNMGAAQSTTTNPNFFLELQQKVQRKMGMLLQTLLHFSDRFRNIYICLSNEDLILFNSLSPSSFPALISLKVADHQQHLPVTSYYPAGSTNSHPVIPSYAPLLDRMPVLEKLILRTADRNICYPDLSCNWAFLTDIDIIESDLLPVDFIRLIMGTPLLHYLRVSVLLESSVQPNCPLDHSSLPPVALTHLTTMRLAFVSQGMPQPDYLVDAFGVIGGDNTDRASSAILEYRMTTIFSHIICPSLKVLYVGQWSSSTGIGSLALSRCPFTNLPLYSLETLSLDLLMKPETLTECLSLATSLTTLELLNQGGLPVYNPDQDTQDLVFVCTFQDLHLKRLTPSSDNFDCLCPKLENFRMIDRALEDVPGQSITTWSTAALTAFIEARADGPNPSGIRPLRSCTLFSQSPKFFSETELETLRALKMAGRMKLSLHQSKTYQMPQDDGATTGLFPPSVSSWSTGFMPPNAIRTFKDLDSMDEINTDIII